MLVHLHSGSLHLSHCKLRMQQYKPSGVAVQPVRRTHKTTSSAHLLVEAAQRQGLAEHEVHLGAQARKDACDWMASAIGCHQKCNGF